MPVILALLLSIALANVTFAEAVRGSLFDATRPITAGASTGLLVSAKSGGMFIDRGNVPALTNSNPQGLRDADVQRIRALIQQAESRKDGYDAVHHRARAKPPKPPTQMTLAEVFAWIDATPRQSHAIGRYQFIPDTLQRVVAKTGVKLSQRFSPRVQDQLADVLLIEAGLQDFRAGRLGRVRFMNNLAKIWAGLPSSNGKSHYDGIAGNRATVTWAQFEAAIAQISPERG